MTERDSRPAVYREGDTIVYRASAVYSCLAALQFARTGLQPSETPANMRRRFDDSSLHEAGIVEHAAKEFGITVVGTPMLVLPITRRVIVRGTIDGQGDDLSIIEAKALSEPGWLKWRRQRWEAFPRYAWQMSVYWLGGEHEWDGPVKRLVIAVKCVSRESEHYGEIDLTEWDAPQVEYSDIAERVLTVEARVASDDEATCDMRDYPCFAAGTFILTDTGYWPIETLQVGDQVLTHLGRFRPILTVSHRVEAPLRRVKAYGSPGLTVTDEHPFWVRRKSYSWSNEKQMDVRTFDRPEWLEAEKLERGMMVAQILPPLAPDHHPEALWGLAGRFVADGYVQTGKGNKVIITCAHDETEEVLQLAAEAGFHARAYPDRTATKVIICGESFFRFCCRFGRYAYGKYIPGFVLQLPTEKAQAFLQGYLGGDGCLVKHAAYRKPFWVASTVSKSLALGLALLGQRAFGVGVSINTQRRGATHQIEGRTVNQRLSYTVRFPSYNRNAWADGDYIWKHIYENEALDQTGTVYNIQVAEDESYVAEGIIVHNCPFFYLGDACGGTSALQEDDVLDEAFEAWARSHRDITVQRNAIQLAYDRSREQGTRYIGLPGKVRVGDYEVTRKEYDRSYLDQKRLKRDDPVTYERYQKATHVVSIGVKEL